MKLVIVTGAGASRELGTNGPLPLMGDWCNRLCEALDRQEEGLAKAAGLEPGLSGEEFEVALGALLRWQELRPLNKRFLGLGGANVGKYPSEVGHSFEREGPRLKAIMATLNRSLYREFGAKQIAVDAAASAYGWLLAQLKTEGRPVFVTTNYDCSIEMALPDLGLQPNTGFIRRPGLSPRLAPEGAVESAAASSTEVAVLHLHGAVGWYQQGEVVIEQYADQPYDEKMGVPSVLYPDPDKDPTRDAAVQLLWDEFDKALSEASHVLVVGHSLHDNALVQRLNRASAHVGYCAYSTDGTLDSSKMELSRLSTAIPHAAPIPFKFGPNPIADLKRLQLWSTGAKPTRSAGM